MKLLLIGCSGRMGRAILENAPEFGMEIAAGVDTQVQPEAVFPIYTDIRLVRERCDCIIDFSHHSMVPAVGQYARKNQIPVLFGATGLTPEELDDIEDLAQSVPVLQSSNMSLGIQVLKLLSEKASRILGKLYDIEIIEKHHNKKKDAPSGTALLLYEAVKQAQSAAVYGRHGADALRQPQEIGLHAIRGGGLPGEHEVSFYGAYDELSLTHRVRDRKVFAIGALQAARYLHTKKSGRYDTYDMIKDLLGE